METVQTFIYHAANKTRKVVTEITGDNYKTLLTVLTGVTFRMIYNFGGVEVSKKALVELFSVGDWDNYRVVATYVPQRNTVLIFTYEK